MKRSDGVLFLALAAISIALILADSYAPFHSLRRGVSSLTYPTRKLFGYCSQLVAAKRRADELSETVMRLILENARLSHYRRENQRLREVLGFELEGYYDLVAAEIVGRHIFPPVTSLTINKGQYDGIEVGMPVCTERGLTGKVAEVYEHTSLVQTLHDRNCVVSCIVDNSEEIGILRSLGSKELYLTGIPLDTDIRKGAAIMSSGLGGVFPKGFFVGAVESVSPDGLGLFSRVKVSPEVNFSAVSEVFVITAKIKRELLPAHAEEELRPAPIFPGTSPSDLEIPEFIDVIRSSDGP